MPSTPTPSVHWEDYPLVQAPDFTDLEPLHSSCGAALCFVESDSTRATLTAGVTTYDAQCLKVRSVAAAVVADVLPRRIAEIRAAAARSDEDPCRTEASVLTVRLSAAAFAAAADPADPVLRAEAQRLAGQLTALALG